MGPLPEEERRRADPQGVESPSKPSHWQAGFIPDLQSWIIAFAAFQVDPCIALFGSARG